LCQVRNRFGHIALDCYNGFNESYSHEQSPQVQAYLSAPSSSSDQNWYPDSKATHHLTFDLTNLNIKANDYMGSNQIRIGNDKGLSIKHIGTTCLSTPYSQFDLLDILHVPQISKNLIFVQKFTRETNTFFEFHPSYFLLKDHRTGKLLLH
jgi:histidinol phosphatase-like PHP family hydrolase